MKYQCKECEHVFDGSSYSTQCPECGDEKIIPFKKGGGNWFEKIKIWVKENKLIAAAIILILFLIIYNNYKDDAIKPPNDVVYSLNFEQNTNFCIVHLIDGHGKKVNYSQALYSFLKLEATMLSIDGTSYDVTVKKNKIEYCQSGDLSIFYVTHDGGSIKLKPTYSGQMDIHDINPSQPNGECMPMIILDDVMYMASKCKVVCKVTEGEDYAYISINGENGDYQKSKSFDVKDITQQNFDVWYYPKGFSKEKKRFNNPIRIKQVLNEIKTSSAADSISKENLENLNEKLIEVINLVKENKISAADDIFLEIMKDLGNSEFSISGISYSIFSLTSEIQAFLQDGGTLKPLNGNIKVESKLQDCGCIYDIKISL